MLTYLFRQIFYQWSLQNISSVQVKYKNVCFKSKPIAFCYHWTLSAQKLLGRRVTWVHIAEYRNYNNTWNLTFISYVTVPFTDSVFKCGHDLSVETDKGRTTRGLYLQKYHGMSRVNFVHYEMRLITPGIRPKASGAATVSPDGKQVGKNFITNLIIIIKVCYLLYIL